MPRSVQSIITRACYVAKVPNYTALALEYLNAILQDLCQDHDFGAARGEFNFTFNQNLVTTGGGNIVTSGPNALPLDYLRTSGSSGSSGTQKSTIWYLQGVPYPMIPCDLAEFDIQVQQAGLQSYPWLWATDVAPFSIVLATQGTLAAGNNTVTALQATVGLVTGMSVAGPGIVPGTTVTGVSGITCTLSQPASATLPGASLIFGTPMLGYAYPPPSGAYNVMLRYQRQMPDYTQAQVVAGAYPWFTSDKYLEKELASRLAGLSDDARMKELHLEAEEALGAFLPLKDDESNRAHTVQLDRRTFGPSFDRLPNTKMVGW